MRDPFIHCITIPSQAEHPMQLSCDQTLENFAMTPHVPERNTYTWLDAC